MAASEHAAFEFLLKSLLNFIDLHYQGNNSIASPFQTHPITMAIALASLFFYCVSYELEPRFARGGLMRWFRSVLSASLASLLSRSPVWLALCSLYVLFSNRETVCAVGGGLRRWVRRRTVVFVYGAVCWIDWRRWFGAGAAGRGDVLPV